MQKEERLRAIAAKSYIDGLNRGVELALKAHAECPSACRVCAEKIRSLLIEEPKPLEKSS